MVYFCEKCKTTHQESELCPQIKKQLKANPALLSGAVDFTNIAGQYHLVTSQSLDAVAQKVNSVIGTNASFEGTLQFARDIQVFNRLNTEAFVKAGVFNSPDAAKVYLESATKGQIDSLSRKIVGSGQEVDWLRCKQGEIRSVIEKSALFNKNAKGVDGEILSRFNGKEITRVTIKGASTKSGIKTGTDGIIKALKNGSLNPDETVFATEGSKERLLHDLDRHIARAKELGDEKTAELLKQAKDGLKIIEHGTIDEIENAKVRLLEKIGDGKADTAVTGGGAIGKAAQGAVIGAVIGLSVSCMTNYIRFKNNELSIDEAFVNIGEDTTKSSLIGGNMGVITCFLPGGVVGVVAGFAVGVYLNAALINIFDEIFGKGAYREILIASGCIMGTAVNLDEAMRLFGDNIKTMESSGQRIEEKQSQAAEILAAIQYKQGVL